MTTGTRGQGRGYTLASYQDAGVFKRVVRFTCVECGVTHDITKVSDTVNPEACAKIMRRLGWEADAWRDQDCRCPLHTKTNQRRKAANDIDSELRDLEAKMGQAPVVSINRDPTQEQRREIRKLLEEHFDEVEGCYRGDWSDEKIASRAQIPMVIVQRQRDTNYGPIRITPETMELRRDLSNLKEEIGKVGKEIEQLVDKHSALVRKHSALEAKVQPKAAA